MLAAKSRDESAFGLKWKALATQTLDHALLPPSELAEKHRIARARSIGDCPNPLDLLLRRKHPVILPLIAELVVPKARMRRLRVEGRR